MTGQKYDNTHGYSNRDFYQEGSISDTDGWVRIDFTDRNSSLFRAAVQILVNDSNREFDVSWDGGRTVQGVVRRREMMEWYDHVRQCIWIRAQQGTGKDYRIFAW